jgi:ribose/xylose/arabinose/galactoside ABC-type transport system permease subunit
MTTLAGGSRRRLRVGQQEIVLGVFVGLFIVFSVFLKGFLTADNMLTLLQNVAVLGILGLAMAIVVIGRGIDISLIATLAVPPGLVLQMVQDGNSLPFSIATALAITVVFGLVNGWLIAYAEVPSLFATLATGIPTRPIIVLQYVLAALIGCFAGLVLAASVNSMPTRIFNSTLIYDVILVVVLGGIGLSGGRGGVVNIIFGTLLIGTLLNGMTIMDMSYSAQNLVKGVLLLAAVITDSILNPRNEETAQQGDI